MPDLRSRIGGPASFQRRLESSLVARNVKVVFSRGDLPVQALLIINASRNLHVLLQAKRRGARIVQRLGSPFPSNSHLPIGPAKRFRTWMGTQNIAFIRARFADRIVYQSRFVKECWERQYPGLNKPSGVIYNGVDIAAFLPQGPSYKSSSEICIISVEGAQCEPANSPAFLLGQALSVSGHKVELLVFGKLEEDAARRWSTHAFVNYRGFVSNDELPYYYRGATFYVSTDIVNAGCPNSVIEALACGTPVVGYDLGVLPEMLSPQAGQCVPAHNDPWKGEPPGNIDGLVAAALAVKENNAAFRMGARALAEERFGLDRMTDQYVNILFN